MLERSRSDQRRVAIVTGGGRGLGRAMVVGLLQHGIAVVAVDRDQAPLDELSAAFGSTRLATVAQDLTAPDAEGRVRAAAFDTFGRIDILVNNAGMGQSVVWPDHWVKPLRVWNIEFEQWKRFFELNTHVVFRMSNMVIPLMMKQGWGRIVNVTTSLGSMLRAGFAPYGASKAAAESLTRITAEELRGTGITVNVLTPGGLTNTAANPGAPFDRSKMIQPEVMVPPLVWLVSDAASAVTGRRFLASHWNASLPPEQAAEEAGSPAAWDPGKSLPREPERNA
jgi:NAD(P)-dependent dehydrogenase (short-subunit alcohol dehydrogenase family)